MILVEEQMQTDLDSQFLQDLARQRMPELCGQRDGRRPFAGIGMDWHGFAWIPLFACLVQEPGLYPFCPSGDSHRLDATIVHLVCDVHNSVMNIYIYIICI